mmetsp:Transcript_23835/g.38846  ORF Transcript_23835/g.38846 Transcript_23835/m.38846 type:complete len:241 (+) Transcript_23835:200-922(+)
MTTQIPMWTADLSSMPVFPMATSSLLWRDPNFLRATSCPSTRCPVATAKVLPCCRKWASLEVGWESTTTASRIRLRCKSGRASVRCKMMGRWWIKTCMETKVQVADGLWRSCCPWTGRRRSPRNPKSAMDGREMASQRSRRPSTRQQKRMQVRCLPCALSTCAAQRSRWPLPLLSWRPACQVIPCEASRSSVTTRVSWCRATRTRCAWRRSGRGTARTSSFRPPRSRKGSKLQITSVKLM